jgi:hypothetical protein
MKWSVGMIDELQKVSDKLDQIEIAYAELQKSLADIIKQRHELIIKNLELEAQLDKCVCKDMEEN